MHYNGTIKPSAVGAAQRGVSFSPAVVSGSVGILDAVLIAFAGLATSFFYVDWYPGHSVTYLTILATVTAMASIGLYLGRLYTFDAIIRPTQKITRTLLIVTIVFFLIMGTSVALDFSDHFSRIWAVSWLSAGVVFILVERTWVYLLLRKLALAGRLTRNIAIVGGGEQSEKLLKKLDHNQEPWNRVIGVFDDRASRIKTSDLGYPLLGNVEDLLGFAREYRVDDIIIALPWNADKRLYDLISHIKELPVQISLGSDLVGFMYPGTSYSAIGGVTMFNIVRKPLSGWKMVVKQIEDKVLATVFTVLFAPVMLLTALLIKLEDGGPILFRQERYGFNNQVFRLYKFRTMHDGRSDEQGVPQATRDDPRVTRIGRLLRRTSLDELPQLFNVLEGSMSLVGPRPHAVEHNELYSTVVGGYFSRHRVKPGMTGWAQVHGLRGETADLEQMKARVKYDVEYIENWSLLLDLEVLVMTAFVVLFQENAY